MKFLSAMRIFGFGNSRPRCEPGRRCRFLSAMRIFGFGNRWRAGAARRGRGVSIRNADFWLWELAARKVFAFSVLQFLSAMRIFGFGNQRIVTSWLPVEG